MLCKRPLPLAAEASGGGENNTEDIVQNGTVQ